MPRALETDEIPLIVKDYANAAKLAIEQAGFAGVHIHGANGYLIDTFIQSKTNHREDKYGGSLENRLRFMTEVIDAVLEEVPAEKVSIMLYVHVCVCVYTYSRTDVHACIHTHIITCTYTHVHASLQTPIYTYIMYYHIHRHAQLHA